MMDSTNITASLVVTSVEYLILAAIVSVIAMIFISCFTRKDEDIAFITFISFIAGFAWPFTIFGTVVYSVCWLIKSIVNMFKK